jgi:8-oxo-dGTP pyrophosphatase MutT (NUDIX family)
MEASGASKDGLAETQPIPKFVFRTDDSLKPYTVSLRDFLDTHPEYDAIATGALVFYTNPEGVPHLLIQKRSEHDSMPGRWETPGGGCDLDDESILHGAVRELWEESGLVAEAVVARAGGEHVFFTRRGQRVSKFNFVVRVKEAGEQQPGLPPAVTLDPNEHQAYLWATEEECRAGRKGDVEVKFTTKGQEDAIWAGFAYQKASVKGEPEQVV